MKFLVLDQRLPEEVTEVQHTMSVLGLAKPDIERAIEIAEGFHAQTIDLGQKLQRIDVSFTSYKQVDRSDDIAMVKARNDIHETVMMIGHQVEDKVS